jgi:hypothetical protein
MIYKNAGNAKFLNELSDNFAQKNLGIIVRFNSLSATTGVVKCAQTRVKIFIDVNEKRIKFTSTERVINTPNNITRSYKEIENYILLPNQPDLMEKAVEFIYRTVTTKSEYLTHIESGNADRINGVTSITELNHTNVFYGVIRGINFGHDTVTVQLDNGQTMNVPENCVEKIPATGNVVGRYFVMNVRKETTLLPEPLFNTMIKKATPTCQLQH